MSIDSILYGIEKPEEIVIVIDGSIKKDLEDYLIKMENAEKIKLLRIKYNLGLVIKPNNSNDFAKAIIKISTDDKLRKEMAKNARNTAEKIFSRTVQTGKIADIFRNISKSL